MKRVSLGILLVIGTFLGAKEITIGAISPMSGPIAGYGDIMYKGLKVANKAMPELKNGDTIKLVLVDSKGDKVETSSAVSRLLYSVKAVAILAETTSTNTAQALTQAEKRKTPIVAAGATNDKIFNGKKYGNRVCFTDSFQGEVVANYAFKDDLKTAVVIIDQAQVYSVGLAKAFKKAYKKAGGKVLKSISITSGDKDFKAVVSQIKSINPDMIYLPLYHPEASMIARQAKEISLDKPMFSGDGVANPTFIALGGKAVEGYMFTDFFDYTQPPTQKSKDFIKLYEKEFGTKEVNSYTALAADSYFVLVNAMNECKDPTDGVCINKKIKSTKNFEGVSGIISIDKSGNAVRSAVIKTIKDGKPVFKATVLP